MNQKQLYLYKVTNRTPLSPLKLPILGPEDVAHFKADFDNFFREPLGFFGFVEIFLRNNYKYRIHYQKAKFLRDIERFRLISKSQKRRTMATQLASHYFSKCVHSGNAGVSMGTSVFEPVTSSSDKTTSILKKKSINDFPFSMESASTNQSQYASRVDIHSQSTFRHVSKVSQSELDSQGGIGNPLNSSVRRGRAQGRIRSIAYELHNGEYSPGTDTMVSSHVGSPNSERMIASEIEALPSMVVDDENLSAEVVEMESIRNHLRVTDHIPRNLFDELYKILMAQFKEELFPEFTRSPHFSRILQLRAVSRINVQREDFVVLRELGKGAFGQVIAAKRKATGKCHAIKVMSKMHILNNKVLRHIMNEVSVLAMISCPFISRLQFAFQDQTRLFLVMDLCLGGDLKYHIRRLFKRRMRLPSTLVRFWAAELVLAIEHLHKKGIAHRDIKPDNILLDDMGHCRLGDFGMAQVVPPEGLRGEAGTPGYWAPEVIKKQSYFMQGDLWSLGCVIFEMLVGICPFHEGKHNIHRSKEERMKIRDKNTLSKMIPFTELFHSSTASLLSGLLHRDPSQRLGCPPHSSIHDLKAHPFFQSIDWGLLAAGALVPPVPSDWQASFPTGHAPRIEEFETCHDPQYIPPENKQRRFEDFEFIQYTLSQKELVEMLLRDPSIMNVPLVKNKSCCTIM